MGRRLGVGGRPSAAPPAYPSLRSVLPRASHPAPPRPAAGRHVTAHCQAPPRRAPHLARATSRRPAGASSPPAPSASPPASDSLPGVPPLLCPVRPGSRAADPTAAPTVWRPASASSSSPTREHWLSPSQVVEEARAPWGGRDAEGPGPGPAARLPRLPVLGPRLGRRARRPGAACRGASGGPEGMRPGCGGAGGAAQHVQGLRLRSRSRAGCGGRLAPDGRTPEARPAPHAARKARVPALTGGCRRRPGPSRGAASGLARPSSAPSGRRAPRAGARGGGPAGRSGRGGARGLGGCAVRRVRAPR